MPKLNQLYKATLRHLFSQPDGAMTCPPPDDCNPILKRLAELDLIIIRERETSETGWAATITPAGAREIGRGALQGALPFDPPRPTLDTKAEAGK